MIFNNLELFVRWGSSEYGWIQDPAPKNRLLTLPNSFTLTAEQEFCIPVRKGNRNFCLSLK